MISRVLTPFPVFGILRPSPARRSQLLDLPESEQVVSVEDIAKAEWQLPCRDRIRRRTHVFPSIEGIPMRAGFKPAPLHREKHLLTDGKIKKFCQWQWSRKQPGWVAVQH
jgi:hypothetical protein